MKTPRPLPAPLGSAPFTIQEAADAGVSRRRLKHRSLCIQARIGADSAPETRLRLALCRAGLPEPVLNVATVLRSGVVREPDLAFPEHRVAVEYEGDGHSVPAQVIRDIAREEDFSGAGWILVRISKRHMENDARAAVAKVRVALACRGWQLG